MSAATDDASRPVAGEAPRDTEETTFTPLLRQLLLADAGVRAVVFIDDEGETIDLVARMDWFDARVVGAQLHVAVEAIRQSKHLGAAQLVMIESGNAVFFLRHFDVIYTLVVEARDVADEIALADSLERVVLALRTEVGFISGPRHEVRVFVDTRPAAGWGYAPEAMYVHGVRRGLSAVLGQWIERDASIARTCFLVRFETGEEGILVRDQRGEWTHRERAD